MMAKVKECYEKKQTVKLYVWMKNNIALKIFLKNWQVGLFA